MRNIFARAVSCRVRELERDLKRVSDDYSAIAGGEFEKHSLTSMSYTLETGLQATFEGNFAKILAAWAFNTLNVANAPNYVEFQAIHPDAGFITITVQRTRGETPGAKAARLEAEIARLASELNDNNPSRNSPQKEVSRAEGN